MPETNLPRSLREACDILYDNTGNPHLAIKALIILKKIIDNNVGHMSTAEMSQEFKRRVDACVNGGTNSIDGLVVTREEVAILDNFSDEITMDIIEKILERTKEQVRILAELPAEQRNRVLADIQEIMNPFETNMIDGFLRKFLADREEEEEEEQVSD